MIPLSIAQNADLLSPPLPPKPDVAFLVYEPVKQRRKNGSFDGTDNIGAYVIKDTLERAGIAVGFCDPATANHYQVILVSLTSNYDSLAFYRAVGLRPEWQRGLRTFQVLAGGFGMQNPMVIRNYVDVAVFGRAEDHIVTTVTAMLDRKSPSHPSLMHLPDIHPVHVEQAASLYPNLVQTGTIQFQESFTGCPLKCKFCHYTYARKHMGSDEAYGNKEYVQGLLVKGSPELTWDQLVTASRKFGRVRSAWDGTSERLRYLYGKRISDEDIIQGLEQIGSFDGNTVVIVYNIGNFPLEGKKDWQMMQANLLKVKPRSRVIMVLHTTPFRPSLLTPMQWEPAQLFPEMSRLRNKVIVDRPTFRAIHGHGNEGAYSHLETLVIERATEKTDSLFHAMCFAPKLRNGRSREKVARVQANFDLTPYLRAYDLDEPPPAWFLQSYIDTEGLRRVAKKMREQARASLDDPSWRLGHASIVQSRLRRRAREARRAPAEMA